MILELYRDSLIAENDIFRVNDIMKDIQEHTSKRFTFAESENIIKCLWEEGMVNFADFMSEKEIDEALAVG